MSNFIEVGFYLWPGARRKRLVFSRVNSVGDLQFQHHKKYRNLKPNEIKKHSVNYSSR